MALDELTDQLRRFHVHGADQDRLLRLVAADDLADHGEELRLLVFVYDVVHVVADHRHVGGYLHDVEVVDALKLLLLGLGRARHTGDFLVHAEIVLERDGGERFGFAVHLHALLGLDRLVQAVGIAPPDHQAPGELVHDHGLAVLHDVVHVALHDGVRLERV